MDVQLKIRAEAEERRTQLAELENFLTDINKKDESLKGTTKTGKEPKKVPPVRGQRAKGEDLNDSCPSAEQAGTKEEVKPSTPEELAESEKKKGNELYAQGLFEDAIAAYTAGLSHMKRNATLLSNRAQAWLKLEVFAEAEADCTQALAIEPDHVKALLRRATARKALSRNVAALNDAERVLVLEENNKQAQKLCKDLKSSAEAEQRSQAADKSSQKKKKRLVIQEVNSSSAPTTGGSATTTTTTNTKVPTSTFTNQSRQSRQGATTRPTATPRATLEELPDKEDEEENTDNGNGNDAVAAENENENGSPEKSSEDSWEQIPEVKPKIAVPTPKLPVPTTAPANLPEFEYAYRTMKEQSREDLLQYLGLIPPSTYRTLFKSSLEADVWMDLMAAKALLTPSDMWEALQASLKVARFDMILLFLSAADKEQIRGWIAICAKDGKDVSQLQKAYDLA
jgi:RNA polymerase II-associated protein 3